MNFYNSLKQLLITSRPIGWLLFSGCFLAGYLYGGGVLNPLIILNFLAFTFPACLLVFGLNDLADYQKDKLNTRKQNWLTGGVLDQKYHSLTIAGIITSGLVLLIFPLIAGNLEMLIWVTLLILLAFAYSFKPFRFKSKPFLELFSNLAGTWLVVMVGLSYNLNFAGITARLSAIFLPISSLVLGIATLSYLADFEADKLAHEQNTIQFLGQKKSIIFSLICFTISSFLISYQFLAFGFGLVVIIIASQLFGILKLKLSFLYQSILVYLTLLFVFFIIFYGLK